VGMGTKYFTVSSSMWGDAFGQLFARRCRIFLEKNVSRTLSPARLVLGSHSFGS